MSPPIHHKEEMPSEHSPLIAELRRDMAWLQGDVTEIKNALLGSLKDTTKPGIIGRVEDAESAIAELRSAEEARHGERRQLSATVIGSAVTSIIGALVAGVAGVVAWLANRGHG